MGRSDGREVHSIQDLITVNAEQGEMGVEGWAGVWVPERAAGVQSCMGCMEFFKMSLPLPLFSFSREAIGLSGKKCYDL